MNKMIEGDFPEREEDDDVMSQCMQVLMDWVVSHDGAITRRELFLSLITTGLMTLQDEDQAYACIGMNEAYLQRFFTEEQLEAMQSLLDVEGEPN